MHHCCAQTNGDGRQGQCGVLGDVILGTRWVTYTDPAELWTLDGKYMHLEKIWRSLLECDLE